MDDIRGKGIGMAMTEQSHLVLAMAILWMVINFFGALFAIKHLRSQPKTERSAATSSNSGDHSILEEAFGFAAISLPILKILKTVMSIFVGNQAKRD